MQGTAMTICQRMRERAKGRGDDDAIRSAPTNRDAFRRCHEVALGELNLITTPFMKRESFAHERELRVVRSLFDPTDRSTQPPPFLKADVDLGALITRILIAPTTPAWLAEAVASVAERYGIERTKVCRSDLYDPCIY